MGNKIKVKLIVICVVFLVTCIFVYRNTESVSITKKTPLKPYFANIEGYKLLRYIDLANDAIKMLDLDDYVYADYEGKNGKVSLYIGYYYTANKVYASHSPTICYPSQGWKIDKQPTNHSISLGPHRIHYNEIITSYIEEQELVLYWYQSRFHTNTKNYMNKIDMGYNKLKNNDEKHAFVRVSVPLGNSTYKEANKVATGFIQAFYPQFIDFITEAGH